MFHEEKMQMMSFVEFVDDVFYGGEYDCGVPLKHSMHSAFKFISFKFKIDTLKFFTGCQC